MSLRYAEVNRSLRTIIVSSTRKLERKENLSSFFKICFTLTSKDALEYITKGLGNGPGLSGL
jgi:hypothetical protein